jgi:predicted acylesterase/phospholipase RssA
MSSERPPPARISSVLAATQLFGGLDAATLDALVSGMESTRVPGGRPLFAQGDAGDAAYLVLSGRLRVERARDGRVELIREVGRGDLVGELSLLTGAPRSASVRAVRDTELGRMPRERFVALLETHPPLAIEITRMLAGLLAAPPAPPDADAGVTTIMVRPAGRGAPAAEVARVLTRALEGMGRATLVSSAAAEAAVGPSAATAGRDDAAYAATARWLDALESGHDHVVYLADERATAWTSRCLRQADVILHVASPDDRPATPLAEPGTTAGRWTAEDLVLVHPAAVGRPRGTARWLEAGAYGRRHHVRAGNVADFARLARRLTGRGIGVALSGGGARGLAHLGFLKALEEAGIPVDEIGGTSMGAVIAAQYAAGLSIADMVSLNAAWHRFRPHRAYTLPFASLVTHRAAQRMLVHMFGDLEYEDCWIEGFACSASLTRSALVVHRRGPVADACLASMAIPGVAPPIVAGDELLVDGGVINNLPARLLTRGADGAVLACDVSPTVERRPGYATTPGAWRVVRDRWGRRRDRPYYPSIFETLTRVAVVGSRQETRWVRETADLYVHPPVHHIGIFAFERLAEIVDAGYHAAREPARGWWEARAAAPARARRGTIGV